MKQRRRRPGYQYWFPARKTGRGWGVPQTWQGWIVVDAYLGFFIVFLFLVLFGGGGNAFLGLFGITLATAALLWICNKKGEPPRRNWGG